MTYVTDTHPLLWYLTADHRLGSAAEAAFDDTEKGRAVIVVPTIVLAETVRVVEKKRLSLKFHEVMRKIEISSNYEVLPLDLSVVFALSQLTLLLELHDRVMVASAKLLSAPLITADSAIVKSGYVRTVW
jgi:predicted nucleic acid-binding protein